MTNPNPLALTAEEEVEFLKNQIKEIRRAQEFKDRAHEKEVERFKDVIKACEEYMRT